MLERLSWKKIVYENTLFCLPALILSLFVGYFFQLLVVSLLGALAWHYYHMLKLSNWLWSSSHTILPDGQLSWGAIFYGLYQKQKKNQKDKQTLLQEIEFFNQGAQSLPDAVILIDDKGFIFWCNKLSERLLGFRWPQDHGQHIANLIRNPEFTSYIAQQNFDNALTVKLYNDLAIEFRIAPYIENQRLILVRDVTEIHQLQTMRSRFFADVNHELRTPLTVLKGYSELLLDEGQLMAKNQHALQVMHQQVKRIDDLISQLLNLSKIEAAPRILSKEVVDVPAMLINLEHEMKVLHGDSHQLSFNIDYKLAVYADQSQLYSVFSNLINNAFYHTPAGSKIEILWHLMPNGAEFRISDNGPGIAAEHINKLTERFYRVDPSRSRDSAGSGLGLAIVKHILNHHQSRLNIDSKVKQGTCFSFVLPRPVIDD